MDSIESCPLKGALAALAKALQDEREALLRQDVMALTDAGSAKLIALHRLNSVLPGAERRPHVEDLRKLAELNQANGALIARRCREVEWALQQLSAMEASSTYDASGSMSKPIDRAYHGRLLRNCP